MWQVQRSELRKGWLAEVEMLRESKPISLSTAMISRKKAVLPKVNARIYAEFSDKEEGNYLDQYYDQEKVAPPNVWLRAKHLELLNRMLEDVVRIQTALG